MTAAIHTASTGFRSFLSLISDIRDRKTVRELARSTAATRPELAASLIRAAEHSWS